MEDFNQLRTGHSYSHETLMKIGQKKNRRIHIYGERFAVGEQAIHIMLVGNTINNAWFVFDSYTPEEGSFYKCIYIH